MKVLVFGADGFIGRNAVAKLGGHDVYQVVKELASTTSGASDDHLLSADLSDAAQVAAVVQNVLPDVVLSCAGVVANDETAKLNSVFTENIIAAVGATPARARVIICGSAGVYGQVSPQQQPVSEDAPLNAEAGYGLSKRQEEQSARILSQKLHVPLTVARIFNPIGAGMHPRLLLPALIGQVQEVLAGKRQKLEVNRLDACRDFIAVDDVAAALALLVTGTPQHDTYNIGSGRATSIQELTDAVVAVLAPGREVAATQLSNEAEPIMACQANIERLQSEFGWQPAHSLQETIKEIAHA